MDPVEQPRRLGLEVEFGHDSIQGRVYDQQDHERLDRPFSGWLGLMSAIESARVADAHPRDGAP
jgi:hypothetical protein